jgi:hypothetical protein
MTRSTSRLPMRQSNKVAQLNNFSMPPLARDSNMTLRGILAVTGHVSSALQQGLLYPAISTDKDVSPIKVEETTMLYLRACPLPVLISLQFAPNHSSLYALYLSSPVNFGICSFGSIPHNFVAAIPLATAQCTYPTSTKATPPHALTPHRRPSE